MNSYMSTKVVNIMYEEYEEYIGRAGRGKDGYFGNPFMLQVGEKKGASIEKYRVFFYDKLKADPEFKKRIHGLKGKILGCFCKPYPCHGDVIAEYLETV